MIKLTKFKTDYCYEDSPQKFKELFCENMFCNMHVVFLETYNQCKGWEKTSSKIFQNCCTKSEVIRITTEFCAKIF